VSSWRNNSRCQLASSRSPRHIVTTHSFVCCLKLHCALPLLCSPHVLMVQLCCTLVVVVFFGLSVVLPPSTPTVESTPECSCSCMTGAAQAKLINKVRTHVCSHVSKADPPCSGLQGSGGLPVPSVTCWATPPSPGPQANPKRPAPHTPSQTAHQPKPPTNPAGKQPKRSKARKGTNRSIVCFSSRVAGRGPDHDGPFCAQCVPVGGLRAPVGTNCCIQSGHLVPDG
jgi:hypothetical protein